MEEELKKIRKSSNTIILVTSVLLCFIVLSAYITNGLPRNIEKIVPNKEQLITHVDDLKLSPFTDSEEDKLASYGEKLIKETYNYFYEKNGNKIGNHLACTNCHLNGGTKAFAAPYVGLTGVFPVYIGREDKIESLEERINGCFERSMNGKAIDVNSMEMRAIITYIKHISKNTPTGKRIVGQGFVKVKTPKRAADPKSGAIVFQQQCQSCHGQQGEGKKLATNKGYQYPPLWGKDSYNDGAGMARVLTAMQFIKGNMPLGATHDNPILTDAEAYDVAAYINSFSRPIKANKEKDYPNLAKKPKDSPYPPFHDNISAIQHKYGPFNF
ncbi:c-type cytochrome [Sphingobacterium sp. SRCM116780]|uniref:c-type cytochrome n=1 Tax=Sphingobacterium sp. SRCM116780 TaxID=2907623 RepID=UPI001F3260AD|nr:c-type cytochrome [Sphingobacterium sp. SRCM116780]UIR56322.1 c-type cytochrome [Sphingobacterium sp. SRCM116780]